MAIPGFVINRIVYATGRFGPPHLRSWLPTAVGLASIPFIVKPIDHGVDGLGRETWRSFVGLDRSELRRRTGQMTVRLSTRLDTSPTARVRAAERLRRIHDEISPALEALAAAEGGN